MTDAQIKYAMFRGHEIQMTHFAGEAMGWWVLQDVARALGYSYLSPTLLRSIPGTENKLIARRYRKGLMENPFTRKSLCRVAGTWALLEGLYEMAKHNPAAKELIPVIKRTQYGPGMSDPHTTISDTQEKSPPEIKGVVGEDCFSSFKTFLNHEIQVLQFTERGSIWWVLQDVLAALGYHYSSRVLVNAVPSSIVAQIVRRYNYGLYFERSIQRRTVCRIAQTGDLLEGLRTLVPTCERAQAMITSIEKFVYGTSRTEAESLIPEKEPVKTRPDSETPEGIFPFSFKAHVSDKGGDEFSIEGVYDTEDRIPWVGLDSFISAIQASMEDDFLTELIKHPHIVLLYTGGTYYVHPKDVSALGSYCNQCNGERFAVALEIVRHIYDMKTPGESLEEVKAQDLGQLTELRWAAGDKWESVKAVPRDGGKDIHAWVNLATNEIWWSVRGITEYLIGRHDRNRAVAYYLSGMAWREPTVKSGHNLIALALTKRGDITPMLLNGTLVVRHDEVLKAVETICDASPLVDLGTRARISWVLNAYAAHWADKPDLLDEDNLRELVEPWHSGGFEDKREYTREEYLEEQIRTLNARISALEKGTAYAH